MANVYEAADAYRRQLLGNERQAMADLEAAYAQALAAVKAQLADLTAEIAAAREAGETIGPSWLFRQQRLSSLSADIARELGHYLDSATGVAETERYRALVLGRSQAVDLIRAALGHPEIAVNLSRLDPHAVEQLAGQLSKASPLRALLDRAGAEAGAKARDALVVGVATGQAPRPLIRSVADALDVARWRAATITRTETLRAYREASRHTWQANDDVLDGWVWQCAASSRTCGFCWSMNGTVHPLSEPMATHASCRCSQSPATKSWADLGHPDVPESRPTIPQGADLFAKQPDAVQRAVLGPAKYAAYKAGDLALDDLRGFRDTPQWGRTGYERPLSAIVGAGKARDYMKAA